LPPQPNKTTACLWAGRFRLGSSDVRVRAMYTLGIYQFASIHRHVRERGYEMGHCPVWPIPPHRGDRPAPTLIYAVGHIALALQGAGHHVGLAKARASDKHGERSAAYW